MLDSRFQYVPLHKKLIRDMDLDKNDILLSCKEIDYFIFLSSFHVMSQSCRFDYKHTFLDRTIRLGLG